jgi:ABC-2 type transport system ATP-binding protein
VELRQHLWRHLRELNARGTTILLTTHYLEEAEALCDRIAIIDHGRLVACDTTGALLRRIDNKAVILTLAQPLTHIPEALVPFHATMPSPTELHINYRPSDNAMQGILDAVHAAGVVVADIRTDEVDLEDIFLQLTAGSSAHAGQ